MPLSDFFAQYNPLVNNWNPNAEGASTVNPAARELANKFGIYDLSSGDQNYYAHKAPTSIGLPDGDINDIYTLMYGPGQIVHNTDPNSNNKDFWQVNRGNIQNVDPQGWKPLPNGLGIADQQNADAGWKNGSWVPYAIAIMASMGAAAPAAAGAGAAEGAGAGAAAGSFGAGSGLPAWAGGAAEGLGGGAFGTGLGAASTLPGLTAGAGTGFAAGGGALGDAGLGALGGAGAGMFSDLASWAGGAGGTSLGGSSTLIDQFTNYLTNRGVTPSDALRLAQQATGGSGNNSGAGNSSGGSSGGSSGVPAGGLGALAGLAGSGGGMSTGNAALDSLLGIGAATIPSLLAWNYFQNLPKPDTAQYQTLINKAGDLSGPLGQFDLNTGTGRNQLTDSLAARGVLGSSFGDQSLTNYNTQRDLGRGSLGFSGIGTQGQLLNSMNATTVGNNKNSTDFLGRLLGGVGGALGTNGTAGTAGGAGGGSGGLLGGITGLYNSIFGGAPTGTTGGGAYSNPLGLLQGSSNTDWVNSLFGGSSTGSTADPYGINSGLTTGASGFGTNNPLSNWLTGQGSIWDY